jgi:hypothetical protein
VPARRSRNETPHLRIPALQATTLAAERRTLRLPELHRRAPARRPAFIERRAPRAGSDLPVRNSCLGTEALVDGRSAAQIDCRLPCEGRAWPSSPLDVAQRSQPASDHLVLSELLLVRRGIVATVRDLSSGVSVGRAPAANCCSTCWFAGAGWRPGRRPGRNRGLR